MLYADRDEAGAKLAEAVARTLGPADQEQCRLVLALPRGGVPVAVPVAAALGAELDVLVVRKLGAPGHEEYALGAIASGGIEVLDDEAVRRLGVDEHRLAQIRRRERSELARRERRFRGSRRPPSLEGATVVLVDDGVATGSTMEAAVRAVRAGAAHGVIVAVPLAPRDTLLRLERLADRVVCLATPSPFFAVGQGYRSFPQVDDATVASLLEGARVV